MARSLFSLLTTHIPTVRAEVDRDRATTEFMSVGFGKVEQ